MLTRVFPRLKARRKAALPSSALTCFPSTRHLASGRSTSSPVSGGASSGSTHFLFIFPPFSLCRFSHAYDPCALFLLSPNNHHQLAVEKPDSDPACLAVVKSVIFKIQG